MCEQRKTIKGQRLAQRGSNGDHLSRLTITKTKTMRSELTLQRMSNSTITIERWTLTVRPRLYLKRV